MEGNPNEKFPPNRFGQPDWQSLSIEDVQSEIDTDNLEQALLLAEIRRNGILGMIQEVEQVLASAERQISKKDWEVEKQALEEQVRGLEEIIDTLKNDTRE